MLGIKKQLIKSMIKLEIVDNVPGTLKIYVSQLKKVADENKIYELYAENALLLLNGVSSLDIDYDKGIATIRYDKYTVSVQRLYKWIQICIDIGIEYYDELKKYWESNLDIDEDIKADRIWKQMKPVLQQAINKFM